MLGWLKRRREGFRIADADWQATLAEARIVGARPPDELERLNALCAEFLARKRFSPTHDLELDERKCRLIAVQACLPVLQLGFDWLKGWREVIVYPGQFRVRRRDHDEDTAVVHEWDDELAGESWSHGPIVLSWADIEQDLADPFEGFNVVIHEIAHKLDGLDGALDGGPPLPGAQRRRRWAEVMQRAYDAHVAEVEAGRETVLDAYAAEAEDEFFAVLSEYYFTAPDVLAEHYAEAYGELRAFYGAVPMPAD
jgi:Mlc titration factor MtfA (ptsG expression regulator)